MPAMNVVQKEEGIRLLLAAFLGAVILFGAVAYVCKPAPRDTSVWSDSTRVSDGFVLIAPYIQALNYDKQGEVLLLDTEGDVVHEWKTKYTTLATYLQPNGNLYAAMTPPINPFSYPSPGTTGLIQELDWEGNVLWEYADPQMTHDFEIMPDGGVAYFRWTRAPQWFANNVVGGMNSPYPGIWTNEIVVVNREGDITWSWKPEDHLNPRDYILGPLIPRHDWVHFNSIRYTEKNPINDKPAFMVSSRHLNTVFIIDAKTGNVIWKSPKDMFATQHDATFLEDGRILLFDNGLFRNIPIPYFVSRVVEVEPTTNEIRWTYPSPNNTPVEVVQFASSIMGSAQRLGNGNTLITESTANTVSEVTPEGETVWSYINYFRDEDGPRIFFKARKYSAVGTEWENNVSIMHFAGVCRAI